MNSKPVKPEGSADATELREARNRLLERSGYEYKDQGLLEEALSHPSINAENRGRVNNQRLEFLGDRVIGLIMADALFGSISEEREGSLTRRYADCVENSRLAEIARNLDLAPALETMPNTAEAKTDKVLADALEALMGAIWRDGGVEAVPRHNGDLERSLNEGTSKVKDSKSQLQDMPWNTNCRCRNIGWLNGAGPTMRRSLLFRQF